MNGQTSEQSQQQPPHQFEPDGVFGWAEWGLAISVLGIVLRELYKRYADGEKKEERALEQFQEDARQRERMLFERVLAEAKTMHGADRNYFDAALDDRFNMLGEHLKKFDEHLGYMKRSQETLERIECDVETLKRIECDVEALKRQVIEGEEAAS